MTLTPLDLPSDDSEPFYPDLSEDELSALDIRRGNLTKWHLGSRERERISAEAGLVEPLATYSALLSTGLSIIDHLRRSSVRMPDPRWKFVLDSVDRISTTLEPIARAIFAAIESSAPQGSDERRNQWRAAFETARREGEPVLRDSIAISGFVGAKSAEWTLGGERLQELRSELDESRSRLSAALNDLESSAKIASDRVAKVNVATTVGDFAKRYDHHKWMARAYGGALAATAIGAAVLVGWLYWGDWLAARSLHNAPVSAFPDLTVNQLPVALIVAKLVPIALLGVGIRVLLQKLNAERHLSIVYAHRIAALQRLDLALRQISDESKTARDDLMVQMFRLILSDPETGYLKDVANEVSFNIMDQAARRVTGAGQ